MPDMPPETVLAAVRLHGAIDPATVSQSLARLATSQIDGLRLARAVADREIAVDELSVRQGGHGPSIDVDRDSSRVASGTADVATRRCRIRDRC